LRKRDSSATIPGWLCDSVTRSIRTTFSVHTGEAHSHVGVIRALAVCDGFSKLLKILQMRGG